MSLKHWSYTQTKMLWKAGREKTSQFLEIFDNFFIFTSHLINLTVMSVTCLWLSLCPHNHHHIGVPLEDKVIFQSEGSFLIWEMLTKFSEFFWRFIISRQNLYLSAGGSVSFVQIHGEFFYYVDSTSYIGFLYYI